MLNRDYAPNQRITAYIDNQLVWGQEPPAPGTAPAMPLTLTVTATSAVIPTTANTTLIANAAGGSGLYTYTFSGPGTLTPNGNTAVASNLPAGVQTFTLLVTDTTTPTPLTIAATVSVTVSSPAPVNTPPTPTVNAGQTATAGQGFAYTVPAFTDLETPGILTYTARINPTNGFSFQADTRLLSGTPTLTGLSSVTITATDPGGLSASTTFTITVAPTPVVVVPASLQVLHRDAGNGQLTTNAIYPYFIVENTGNTAIPYSELTVRYWLTVENPAPVTNLPVYNAGVGAGNVQPVYVSLNQVRTGATGYVEYRFGAGAGSLAAMSNSGVVSTAISKADYSPFAQDDDYSYTLNRDFVLNARMTAYVSGRLVWGSEPPVATRLAAGSTDAGLQVTVLGNPAGGGVVSVEVRGAGGQPLRLVLTDISGRLVSEQGVEQAEAVERQTLMADHLPTGLLLLRVSPPTRSQIVKVLKP